ncbi:MAG: hemolysin family protein, partial [Mariprofundaceae bacterium]
SRDNTSMNRWRRWLIERLQPGRNEEELAELVTRAPSITSDEHRGMLHNLVGFGETRVREIMVPRADIKAVDASMDLEAVAEAFAESGFSRLPVFGESLDDIQGVAYAKDVFIASRKNDAVQLTGMLRPCLMVPESQMALRLLSLMKDEGSHIAIVRDEYGDTAGLVTLSDLLAEIVGDIEDADDQEIDECKRLKDGSFLVQARMQVEDLEDVLGVELAKGDFDTVGGLILSHLGRIPSQGERLEVGDLLVHIVEAEPRRLLKVRIEAPDAATTG